MNEFRFQFETFLSNVIKEHRHKAPADQSTAIVDFVDALLRLQTDKTNEARGFSDDVIKVMLLDMLLAGTETTGNSVLWAMAELMRNPEVMEKVQQELDAVVGKERLVEESDLEKLPYFRAVTNESLRNHPAAPTTAPHLSVKATKLGGYDIPINTKIVVNIHAIQRDPKSWPNPSEFKPERWLEGQVDHKRKQFEYFPFGAGRRMCPGMNLGMLIFSFTLAQLSKLVISRFLWV